MGLGIWRLEHFPSYITTYLFFLILFIIPAIVIILINLRYKVILYKSKDIIIVRTFSDIHTISIDSIRKIERNNIAPKEIIRRWERALYDTEQFTYTHLWIFYNDTKHVAVPCGIFNNERLQKLIEYIKNHNSHIEFVHMESL